MPSIKSTKEEEYLDGLAGGVGGILYELLREVVRDREEELEELDRKVGKEGLSSLIGRFRLDCKLLIVRWRSENVNDSVKKGIYVDGIST